MNRKYFGCKVEGCNGQHRRKGYCQKHSVQFLKGTLGLIKERKTCSIEGCTRDHYSKTLCNYHYQIFKKSKNSEMDKLENLNTDLPKKEQKKCTKEGCDKPHWAKGLCGTHYAAFRKENDIYKQNNEYAKGNITFEYADRTNWSLSVKQVFSDKCMICGWEEASCDVHHIIPVHKNGKNTLTNAAVLCCNHHKLADLGKIKPKELQEYNNKAIIKLTEESVIQNINNQTSVEPNEEVINVSLGN